jgi:hypothetical protein
LVIMGLIFLPFVLLRFFMIPPSAWYDILALLLRLESPFIVLYQRFNCPVAPGNDFPVISNISPADGEQNVSVSLSEISFTLYDHEGDLMSYKVETYPDIGYGNGTLVSNGTYVVPIQGLHNSSSYVWRLYLYEGDTSGTPLGKTYTFTTAPLAPFLSNPLPRYNASYVPISTSTVSFNLTDFQGDLMNWTVETQPNIGSASAHGVGNGRYSVAINNLEYYTRYLWFVNATDGTYWTNKTYIFTVAPEGLTVLEPSADTYVNDHTPDDTFWMLNDLFISCKGTAYPSCWDCRGLVVFNLSGIPSGSTITSANLSLYYYDFQGVSPAGREITCHRILDNWDEKTVTYHTMPASNPVECSNMTLPGYFTWVDWNVTSEVDDFINHGAVNHGWMIRDYKDPVGQYSHHYYYSSNAPGFHPRLFIWFNPP